MNDDYFAPYKPQYRLIIDTEYGEYYLVDEYGFDAPEDANVESDPEETAT